MKKREAAPYFIPFFFSGPVSASNDFFLFPGGVIISPG